MSSVTPINAAAAAAAGNARRRMPPSSRRRATIICGGEDISDVINSSFAAAPSRRASILPGTLKRPRFSERDNNNNDDNNDNTDINLNNNSLTLNVGNTCSSSSSNSEAKPASESSGGTPIPVKMAREEVRFSEEEEDLRISVYRELENSIRQKYNAQHAEVVRLKPVNKDEAFQALRRARAFFDQLKALIAMENHPSRPLPPEYRRVKRPVQRVVRFPDVPADSLQVTVNSVDGLTLQGNEVLDTYVYAEFRFAEGLPWAVLRSGQVRGTGNPAYKYTTFIPIERKKCFVKYFERRKITFSVFQKRPFFLPDALLAKFDVPLAGLVAKAENEIICPLYQLKAKRSGQDSAVAHVTVRLQVPLIGEDVRTVEEEDIEIIGEIMAPDPPTGNAKPDSSEKTACDVATLLPAPSAVNTNVEDNKTEKEVVKLNEEMSVENNEDSATSSALTEPSVAAAATTTTVTVEIASSSSSSSSSLSLNSSDYDDQNISVSASNSFTNALRNEARSVKRYNSCELAEIEIKRIDTEIKKLEALHKQVPSELRMRRNEVENQLTVLVVLVQNGKLTIEQYIKNLRAMMAADEALLEKLRSVPELRAEAAMTLSRINILKKEIQSGGEQ